MQGAQCASSPLCFCLGNSHSLSWNAWRGFLYVGRRVVKQGGTFFNLQRCVSQTRQANEGQTA